MGKEPRTRPGGLEDAKSPHEVQKGIDPDALCRELDDTVVLAHIDDAASTLLGERLDGCEMQILGNERFGRAHTCRLASRGVERV